MALTALNWKKLLRGAVYAAGNIDTILDAIWTTLNSATYYNGDARALAAGSAIKNLGREGTTDAIYWEYVTGTHKSVIGGWLGSWRAHVSMGARDGLA